MIDIIALIFQFLFIAAISPFAVGLTRFIKARLQGRHGASPILPYFALATMFKKQIIIPKASSWIFIASPFVVLASSFGFALLMPSLFHEGAMAGFSDFLIIAGILMIGSIFLVLGGIDPGSAFGGMGSSREMTITSLLEPALILIFATYSLLTGSFTVDGMFTQAMYLTNPFIILTIFSLIFLTLGENARYPVDNPATHLELTMIHEAMILEYSGPYLAMMEFASAIKMTTFFLLLGNIIFPSSVAVTGLGFFGFLIAVLIAIAKIIFFSTTLALVESTIVKMRFYRMNEFVSVAFFLAFFGIISALLTKFLHIAVSYFDFFSIATIIFSVFLFGNVRIKATMRYYILSSLSVAITAIFLGLDKKEEMSHLLFFAAGTIVIKVILAPLLINYAIKNNKTVNQLKSFLKPASSYFLAALILVISFFMIIKTPLTDLIKPTSVLFAAIVLVLLGVVGMVIRRNIFSQIVGLLVLENGLALFTLVTVKTLPVITELGIFSVTIVTVIILSKLSIRIKELYGSTDTEELRNLID